MKALLSSLQTLPVSTASTDVNKTKSLDITRRRSIGFGSSAILSSLLVNFCSPSSTLPSFRSAIALQQKDELQLEEDRVVQLFQVLQLFFIFFFLGLPPLSKLKFVVEFLVFNVLPVVLTFFLY